MQRETLEIWARLGVGERRRRARRPVAHRPHLLPRPRSCSRSPARRRRALPAVREHQPVGGRGAAGGAPRRARRQISTAATASSASSQDADGVTPPSRPMRARVTHRFGLPGRDRWRPFGGSPRDRHRFRRLHVRRPLPDRRHPRRAARSATSATSTSTRPGTRVARSSSTRSPTACGASTGRCRQRPMRTPSAPAAASIGASARSSAPRRRTSWCG